MEVKLFYLFSFLNLIPIFLVKYFGAIDAPLHLYQANVIGELWRSNELFEQFFRFNTVIVGNLISQYILAVLNVILPAWMAEKILLSLYILGIAFAFRYLITGIQQKMSYISFLIFPFTYNTMFHFSHYNYIFGIVVMLIIFAYWIRIEKNLDLKKIITLLLLFTLLFISHMFVYTFFVGSFGLYLLFKLFVSLKNQGERRTILYQFLKKTVFISVAILPSIILSIIYWKSLSGQSNPARLSFSQLLIDLYNLKILIGYHYTNEGKENNYLFVLLCVLLLFAIFHRTRRYLRLKKENEKCQLLCNIEPADFWLLLTLIFLLFYFIIPDQLTAGNISARLSILMFTFFIVWLCLQKFPRFLEILAVTIIIIYSINIRVIQHGNLAGLDTEIGEICELNNYMEPNSVYYPINYHPSWIQVHFLNYVGVESALVSAELPICYGTFPIIDTRNNLPVVLVGNVDLEKFCWRCSNRDKSNPSRIVDYIIIGGAKIFSSSGNYDTIKNILQDHYEIIYTSSAKNIELYKLKS